MSITGAILKKHKKNKVIYYNKVKTKKEALNMSQQKKYDEDFKKSIVAVYQNGKS
ncbi:MAG: hypothetical protein LUG24_08785 [Clostridiales bacterium]|nr:hypothetical protein [Clostridiales bacterium]